MALNPFEQLEFLVPAPHRAFGGVVEAILRDRLGPGVLRACTVEGKTYAERANELILYQAKYFVGRWESRQRREIRNGLQQALRDVCPPQRWALCIPTRITSEDFRWFEQWRSQQPVQVELLDGNELSKLLRESACRPTLERLRTFGVTVPGEEPARLHGRLRIHLAGPHSGLSHYLYVFVCHWGTGRAAEDLRIELAHSATGCFSLRHDDGQWRDEGKGVLNPRVLRARRALLPQEERLAAVIPICLQTPLPITLSLKFSTAETAMMTQHVCVDPRALSVPDRLDFAKGPGPDFIRGNAAGACLGAP